MLHTVKLLAERGGRILMVYKTKTNKLSLPGGKLAWQAKKKRMEKPIKGLRRELKEEVPKLACANLRFWKRFRFLDKGERYQITVFKAKARGPLLTENEIAFAAWVRIEDIAKLAVSSNTQRIVTALVHERNGCHK